MNIIADDKIPFLKGVFEPFANIDYLPGDQIKPAMLKNTDVLITRSITLCNADLLENSNVKFIATATIGDDHIDKGFCSSKEIEWTTAKGCNAGAVEQYILTALLEIASNNNFNLSGKTIGIIGVGNIGSRVSKASEILGMKVLLNDPPREKSEESSLFCSIQEIQQKADIITLHVPLTYEGENKTSHILDGDFFNGLAKPVILLNTSRGGVIDTATLIKAKTKGLISNLVLDVWENEPFIDIELLKMADIATPHIAGYSLVGKANGTAMVVNSISKFFSLGIKNWYPELSMENINVSVDCLNMSVQEVLYRIYRSVYSVQNDSEDLKSKPEKFQELRRTYDFRKENSNVDLEIRNSNNKLNNIISGLGFNLKKE